MTFGAGKLYVKIGDLNRNGQLQTFPVVQLHTGSVFTGDNVMIGGFIIEGSMAMTC